MMSDRPTPLLLVHGFAQTPRSWDSVVSELGADRRIEAVELRGHGETALGRGAPTVQAVRTDVADAAAVLGAPVAVWGYSQGARVALDLALERPGLVGALILESGTPGFDDPLRRAERETADDLLAERIEKGSIRDFLELWERVPALSDQSAELMAGQREDRLRHDPLALAAALRGIGQAAYEPMWERLAELTVPVLLLTGRRDRKYTLIAERMLPSLSDGRHVVVEDAGHSVHVERPAEAASVVERFLGEVDGRA